MFASTAFNADAPPVHIAGTREMNRDLFRMLAGAGSIAEAADIFSAYTARCSASPPSRGADKPEEGAAARRYRTGYLRLLRGWAYDSNSPEGAVLKGWVESRFGLMPTYHKQPLTHFTVAGLGQIRRGEDRQPLP